MLIDAGGVRANDTGNLGIRASGNVRWPTLHAGHLGHPWWTAETPAVSPDAVRLFGRLLDIFPTQPSESDDKAPLRGGSSVLVLAEPSVRPANVRVDQMATSTPESSERRQLESRLWWAFESEPLEDGMDHPAEQLLAEYLNVGSGTRMLDWISEWCLDTTNATFAASVLQCLARQPHPGTVAWRAELVRNGLATPHVEIRDAAAKAADSWEDAELLPVLEGHREPVPWLADFIRDIVTDRE